MIPAKSEYETTSTMVGEKIAMGIDPKSLAFIQTVLTDLYSDPELAVVREYSTNAADSHREAGHTEPIEIKLPNSMDNTLRVRDRGVGLSIEDIREMYSLYGASSKRENVEANGMLGLGSKSALTYNSQFTVRAVKNGKLISVLVTRDDDGASAMQILQNVDTDEPNGVEIAVPAKPGNNFRRKAENFFKFWINSKIPVLIDGNEPEYLDATWITDEVAIFKERAWDRNIYVHMAGVTYKLRDYDLNGMGLSNYYSVVFFVPPGSVDFTPNREDLMYTRRTKELIEKYRSDLKNGLQAAIEKEIDEAPTAADAVNVFKAWRGRVSWNLGNSVTWKGKKSPEEIEWDEWFSLRAHQPNFYAKEDRTPYISLDADTVIVTGKSNKSITNAQRAKLRTWLEQEQEVSSGDFIFIEKDKNGIWTQGFTHVKWSEILAVKPTANKSNALKAKPEHYVLHPYHSRRRVDVDNDVDKTKPIGFASLQEINPSEDTRWGRLAEMTGTNIYMVPKAKINGFKKKYPTAKPFKEMLVQNLHDIWAGITEAEKKSIKEDQYLRTAPAILNKIREYGLGDRVKDPRLADLIKRLDDFDHDSFEAATKKLVVFQETMRYLRQSDVGDKWDEYYEMAWRSDNYTDSHEYEYVLLNSIYNWTLKIAEHAVIYINAMYEEKIKEQNATN